MLDNAVFCSDYEFVCVALFSIVHNACCAAGIVGESCYCGRTFRMNEQESVRVLCLSFFNVLDGHTQMSGTTAAYKLECLIGTLFLNKIAEVAVRYKKYLVAVKLFYDLYCA